MLLFENIKTNMNFFVKDQSKRAITKKNIDEYHNDEYGLQVSTMKHAPSILKSSRSSKGSFKLEL